MPKDYDQKANKILERDTTVISNILELAPKDFPAFGASPNIWLIEFSHMQKRN